MVLHHIVFLVSSCPSEVKLSVASCISDRIVDEILESLSRSQHTLVSLCPVPRFFGPVVFSPHLTSVFQAEHLVRKDQPLVHHGVTMETEVLDEVVLQRENQDMKRKPGLKHGLEDMESCMVGPGGLIYVGSSNCGGAKI